MLHTLSFVLPGFWECVVVFAILSLFVLPAMIGGSLMWIRLRDKMKGIAPGGVKKIKKKR